MATRNVLRAVDSLRRAGVDVILARVHRRLRSRGIYPWLGGRLYPTPGPIALPGELPRRLDEDELTNAVPLPQLDEAVAKAKARRFSFLNLPEVSLGRPANWSLAPGGNRLWQYTLHYGEWAIPLAQAGARHHADALPTLTDLLGAWIDGNPPGSTPGWEPYPLSRRLVNWMRLPFILGAAGSEWRDFWSGHLEPSLRQQARFLRRNLEHDVPNNHLLTNYRALASAGMLFSHWPESERLTRLGLAGLWYEARRQVLEDGVHDERSISYHTIVLQDLLESWRLASLTGHRPPGDIERLIRRMLDFLAASRAPGGSWPMINDSIPGYPCDPVRVLVAGAALFDRPELLRHGDVCENNYARWLGAPQIPDAESLPRSSSTSFPNAGYAILQRDDLWLFFDAGPVGPDRIPGHGHADALSFELHFGDHPLIVDPGVFTYDAGPWRDHFRATSSHNTVTVDGASQCDFWGPFRVARPPKARLLSWSDEHVEGEHDGYQRLGGPVRHRRRISQLKPGLLEIEDSFDGKGSHFFDLTLQFSAQASAHVDRNVLHVSWPGGLHLDVKPLDRFPDQTSALEEGWVSTDWNLKTPAPRYRVSWRSSVPSRQRLSLRIRS